MVKILWICVYIYISTYIKFITSNWTTACNTLFHCGRILISNVCDSWAVLGRKVKDSAIHQASSIPLPQKTIPLCCDQKSICNKLEWVNECGIHVMTFDQLTGNLHIDKDSVEENDQGEYINLEETMTRLWFKDSEKPGMSFTRSIGNSWGKKVVLE